MGDLTVIILSLLIIVLCWIIIKINEKLDRHINRFKKLEKALLKNATGKIPIPTSSNPTPLPGKKAMVDQKDDIPMAATSMDLRPQSHQMIAKK
ncbi:MAG: hypothetical protein GY839_14005 [candidate division Zixibacteria bacterium]|nr:hypothetical protein [candidate division Zixibacteria bacterium]